MCMTQYSNVLNGQQEKQVICKRSNIKKNKHMRYVEIDYLLKKYASNSIILIWVLIELNLVTSEK